VVGATLYIISCTARNRMRKRLRRLREPRYMVGAVAGLAYLVFTLLIRQRAYRARDRLRSMANGPSTPSPLVVAGPVVASVLLACASAASWVMPFQSGLLEFSPAETAFLFPSPLSRAQLVIYRLMRSQLAVLTGALIMALAYPTGSFVGRLRGLVGVWLLLMTSHVYFTGVTLARRRLARRDGSLLFVWPAVAISAGAVLSIVAPLVLQAVRVPLTSVGDVVDAVVFIARHGAARVLTWPFVSLVSPIFADSLPAFVRALVNALAVYVVTVGWVIWADRSSPDAADAATERQVSRPARRTQYVARGLAWRPGETGRPEVAFIWKSALQTIRMVDRRVFARVLLILAWMVGASMFATRTRGLVLLLSVFATWGAVFAVFMAPQIIRTDLRQDLASLELLKTWPVRGASVIRGEIIWPTVVVTGLAWTFGLLAMIFAAPSIARSDLPERIALWLGLMLVTPAIVLTEYAMHNAAAILFPGWVRLGATRLRGVDAVGQRLILLAANWMALAIALLPGIAVTVLLFLLLQDSLGMWVLPIGAIVTTAFVLVEMLLATEALGPVYDALDLTSVERPD
jgi:hypothetical protein